jgi:hypothetical protein
MSDTFKECHTDMNDDYHGGKDINASYYLRFLLSDGHLYMNSTNKHKHGDGYVGMVVACSATTSCLTIAAS